MLNLNGIHKAYAGNAVLEDVDFEVQSGEVHALLGPNGAGKSTLIKCIGGGTPIDAGEMYLDGARIGSLTPTKAFELGVATIHQHLSLIESISVMDNIFLGNEIKRWGITSRREQIKITEELLKQHNVPTTPSTIIGDLPIGIRQQVEILKAWNRTSIQVLILDEPTAAISSNETERLFEKISDLRKSGVAIVYTTHRMGEVFRIADRVTVLNSGKVSLSEPIKNITPDDLIQSISMIKTEESGGSRKSRAVGSASVLEMTKASGIRFGPVDGSLRENEVVGLFGAVGSGRTSLLETLNGHYIRSKFEGHVAIDGKEYVPSNPRKAYKRGIRFVAADRSTQGLWSTLAAGTNVLMGRFNSLAKLKIRRRGLEHKEFNQVASTMALDPPNFEMLANEFSGGNQQKLVVGRIGLGSERIRILILDEPTQGVDIGAREKIYSFIETLLEEHRCGVLISSNEPEELMLLCDRVLVMRDGELVANLFGKDLSEDNMMRAAHQFVA